MDFLKVIGIAVVATVLYNLVKNTKGELSIFVIIGAGILILSVVFSSLGGVISEFQSIIEVSGVDNELFTGVLKVVGIAYITEYAAGLCRDAGAESISKKVLFSGKIGIFALSLPIVKALVNMLVGFVK